VPCQHPASAEERERVGEKGFLSNKCQIWDDDSDEDLRRRRETTRNRRRRKMRRRITKQIWGETY